MSDLPIRITADSVCDLPKKMADHYGITIFNYTVRTAHGRFIDNREIGCEDLLNYLRDPRNFAKSSRPSKEEYRHFFQKQTAEGHQVIHITMGKNSSEGYANAAEAAEGLAVTVVDSGLLSSTMGFVAIRAAELALLGKEREEILAEINEYKRHQRCTFMVGDAEYLYRGGRLSHFTMDLCERFLLRPVLKMKKSGIHAIMVAAGDWKHAAERYIGISLMHQRNIDTRFAFITHVGLTEEELDFVREEVLKRVKFKEIISVNASAAISCNGGEGTFGILFSKGKQLYIPEEFYPKPLRGSVREEIEPEKTEKVAAASNEPEVIPEIHMSAEEKKRQLVMQLAFLDVPTGLTYCANDLELYIEILKEYVRGNKSEQLDKYLNTADWEDYRIMVHAIKSGSKTIGALELFEETRLLEQAAKDGDRDYVRENHALVMLHYNEIRTQIREALEA